MSNGIKRATKSLVIAMVYLVPLVVEKVGQPKMCLTLAPECILGIARRIGDKFKEYQDIGTDSKLVVKGDYENLSKYVRVEVDERVSKITTKFPTLVFK